MFKSDDTTVNVEHCVVQAAHGWKQSEFMTKDEIEYGKHKLHVINPHTPHMMWWPWNDFYSYAEVRVREDGKRFLDSIGGTIHGE